MDTPIFNNMLLKVDVKRNIEQRYEPTKAVELFAPSIIVDRNSVVEAVEHFFDSVMEFIKLPFRTLFGSSKGRHHA